MLFPTRSSLPTPTSSKPRLDQAGEQGFVIVPVMAFLLIALALGFAMLLLVDRQTASSSEQRDLDASQVFAEGVSNATANVLALPSAAAEWKTGACRAIAGDLTTPPAGTTTVDDQVRAQVQRVFRDDAKLTSYARGGRTVSWSATICPTTDTDATPDEPFTDAVLSRTGLTTGGALNGRRTLWVRGRVRLLSPAGRTVRSGAAAQKVQQGSTPYGPPAEFAIGTGNFSTDLGSTTASALKNATNSQTLLNGFLGKTLGTNGQQLIEDDSAKIGVRCGVLNGLEHLSNLSSNGPLDLNLCLGGVFSGLNGIGAATNLNGLLGDLTGSDRYTTLTDFAMAPPQAIDAYRDAAIVTGTYFGGGGAPIAGSSTTECAIDWSKVTKDTVVFIEQIGSDGEGYCTIPATRTAAAKAFIVARGGLIVRGKLTSVVNMLNLNECAGAPAATGCTPAWRAAHRGGADGKGRELVRVEGDQGSITGAVWTDGAYSKIGLYPATATTEATVNAGLSSLTSSLASTSDSALCNVGGSTPLVGPVLTAVSKFISGLVSGLLGGVSDVLFGKVETEVLPAGSAKPTGAAPADKDQACGLVTGTLKALKPVDLLNALSTPGSVPIGSEVWIRKSAGVTSPGYDWRLATQAEINASGQPLPTALPIGSALISPLNTLLGVGNSLTNLASGVSGAFANRTMITRSPKVIGDAGIPVPNGLKLVPGTFRASTPNAGS